MVKRLDRYILQEIVSPFLVSLGVIVFVLLSNFLIKTLDKLIGKGLSAGVIFEFLYLNMAWILALAVPMAVLVATLMAYGRLSEDNEITAMRASGISFLRIVQPAILFSIIIALLLLYFNDRILPEFNHRARLLRGDIYRKRPSLDIEPGYFMNDLPDYSLFVKEKQNDDLKNVIIYNKESAQVQTTIFARKGHIEISGSNVILTLYEGEIHELNLNNPEEYRRMAFKKHVISIPVDDLLLQRRESSYRGDREMTIKMMRDKINSYRQKIARTEQRIWKLILKDLGDSTQVKNFEEVQKLITKAREDTDPDLTPPEKKKRRRALQNLERRLQAEFRLIRSYQYQINRYSVEVHKKFSIPFACIVFVLIGAPMGNLARKGGIVVGVSLSILFFLFYWAFLIGGEELADMNLIPPFWAMWNANLLLLLIGIYLIYFSMHDQASIDWKGFILKLRISQDDN